MTMDTLRSVTGKSTRQRPVFVLGSPRSGTTILARSLGTHSELHALPETDVLFGLFGNDRANRVYQSAQPGTFLRVASVGREEFFESLGSGIDVLFSRRSNGKEWIDHTPVHTLMAATIAELFPGARFLHIIRDGRKVVNSMIHFGALRKAQGLRRDANLHSWAEDFEAACRTWAQYLEAGTSFSKAQPDRCLTISHEDLSDTPQEEFDEILRFLDVRYEDAPAVYLRTHRINSSYPPHYSSGSGADQPDPWSEWSAEQKSEFVRHAGPVMMQYGFITESELASMREEAGRELVQVADQLLGNRVRSIVSETLPRGSKLLVVSSGDNDLLEFDARPAQHFPQTADGSHAGYYPANDAEAIGHLEILHARGAEFLLIPNTAFWWLEHYDIFARHLRERYSTLHADATCMLFALSPIHSSATPSPSSVEYR